MPNNRLKDYINNQFVPAKEYLGVVNPATEKVIAQVPRTSAVDIDLAVQSAKQSQRQWKKYAAVERGEYLRNIAAVIRDNRNHLAKTISEEQGKVMQLAEGEVDGAAGYFDYVAEWARRIEGEVLKSDRPDEHIFINYHPIGVVAGILPWNFPFYLIARKVAPALLTGNSIVIKPSPETPVSAYEFAKLLAPVDLPKGVFNIINGDGRVGNNLVSHADVGMVTFTGSVPTGKAIMKSAAENITKVSLELGGNAPVIVMADADIDLAVEKITDSRIINTGQVCNCAERIYVEAAVAEEFIDKISTRMSTIQSGDPIKARESGIELDMGPLINADALERLDNIVKEAVSQGAEVVEGGKINEGPGWHYAPTVLVNCNHNMSVMSQEIFGPVLPIQVINNLDEGIGLANDSKVGLTSAIFTTNLNTALRASREIEAGETYVNREHMETYQGFHAGVKQSGIGGDDGRHGLYEYMDSHITYIQET